MRAYVFTDKALAKHAGQFVWLSIDTEKTKNAAFSKKYPIKAWPSFYVIDPAKERIALRWVGGATVTQLEKLFAEGTQAVKGNKAGSATALAQADVLYGEGRYREAAGAYRDALKAMTPKDPQYSRAVESALFSYQTIRKFAGLLPARPRGDGAAQGNGLGRQPRRLGGLDCSLSLPASTPWRAQAIAAFEADVRAVLENPS